MKNKNIKIIFSMLLILLIGIVNTALGEQDDKIDKINNNSFKNHVVFYPQHQDDEVLWGGSAIVKAIEQRGAENVYVVLVSDGSGVI